MIFVIRGQKVIVGADLATLFGVNTRTFNQAVRRNKKRFPADFMFELSLEERNELVTHCDRFKNLKYSRVCPRVFTKRGILMLPFVLNSPMAIRASVQIVEMFVQLSQIAITHEDLATKIRGIEKDYDKSSHIVFEAIYALMKSGKTPERQIEAT